MLYQFSRSHCGFDLRAQLGKKNLGDREMGVCSVVEVVVADVDADIVADICDGGGVACNGSSNSVATTVLNQLFANSSRRNSTI